MIRHIAILDSARGIAKDGDQPVHLPGDQAYFRAMTISHGGNILMGRATYDVIGILKGRRNFIATHQEISINGAESIREVTAFLETFNEDIWIIGGAALFASTLTVADELYLTEIQADLGCDQFYPAYHEAYEQVNRSVLHTENGLRYRFCEYCRK